MQGRFRTISAWISNTATTAMMFGIGLSILAALRVPGSGISIDPRYATALMLMTSFAASIGGRPRRSAAAEPDRPGVHSFSPGRGHRVLHLDDDRCARRVRALPVSLLFLNAMALAGVRELPAGAEIIRRERETLVPWTRGQRSVAVAFGGTIALWVLPGVVALAVGEDSPL
jgi:solute carrier family 13 (sodium-dependent dicarboxylate transporter), member 2/3/5